MSHRSVLAVLALALSALFAAPAHAAPVYDDPAGDSLHPSLLRFDIDWIQASYDATDLFLTVAFEDATPISAPSAGEPNSVGGFIDLDVDQDPATGYLAAGVGVIPDYEPAFGSDFLIDLGAEADNPGSVRLFDNLHPANDPRLVPIAFTSTAFTITLPLAWLSDDGLLNYTVLLANATDGLLEVAPNAGFATSEPLAVPLPTTAASTAALLTFGALARLRRRRA